MVMVIPVKQRYTHGSLQLKRGCLLPKEPPKLKLRDYLVRPMLPKVPKVFGHLTAAAPPGGWSMLGNNNKGDCVMAGAAHETMLWAWATNRSIPKFDTAGVVGQYLNLTGGADTGLDPVSAAQWRQNVGITDADGKVHKIDAYVQIENVDELKLAGYLFGCAGQCWSLPDTAEDQFSAGQVWNDLSGPPDPDEGHYTPFGGVNSVGNLEFLTWGQIQGASEAYTAKYMVTNGCIAYLSQEYLLATGLSPEAINWGDLEADLQEVTAAA